MKGHLLAKKSPGRKRHLGKEALVERSDTNNVRDCLPYAGVR
jgi:ribosomal protein L35